MSDSVRTVLSDSATKRFADYDEYDMGSSSAQKKDFKFTLVKIIVIILGVLLLLEGIVQMMVVPCLAPIKVEFSGLKTISSKMLLDRLSEVSGSTWIQFDANKAVSALSGISGIDTVSIDKVFPDKVVISIKERDCVAKTIVSVNGRTIPVQIDKNGVLFTTGTDAATEDSNIPLVSGLPVENMQAGMRFPAKYRPLMEQIASIQELAQPYFAAISEIQVVTKEYGNYELVLYPIDVNTRVRVLTDRILSEDALKYMMVVLDVVKRVEPDVSEIDLRCGAVSYRSRVNDSR